MNTQDSGGKQQFQMLVDAIRIDKSDTVVELREYWEEICQYVKTLSKEKLVEVQRQLGEKELVLTLWLSTPITPDPIDWADPTLPNMIRRERKDQIELVDHLWSSWFGGSIIEQLEMEFKQTLPEFANAWLSHASDWRHSFPMTEVGQKIADPQVRLDIATGYSTFVDRLLLDQGVPFAESSVSILCHEDTPTLELPNKSRIPLEMISSAVQARSHLDDPQIAVHLTGAISFSLPAHGKVLYGIAVELNRDSCLLKSGWQDPFPPRNR